MLQLLSHTIIFVLLVVLLLQSAVLIFRPENNLLRVTAGILTLFGAMTTAARSALLGHDRVALSPELGAVLAQTEDVYLLRAYLIIYSLASGFLLLTGFASRGSRSFVHPIVVFLLALAVGVFSAFQVERLGTSIVFRYDTWSPALFLWLILCVGEWALLLINVPRLRRHWIVCTGLLTVCVFCVDSERCYASALTAGRWSTAYALLLFLVIWFPMRLIVRCLGEAASLEKRIARPALLRLCVEGSAIVLAAATVDRLAAKSAAVGRGAVVFICLAISGTMVAWSLWSAPRENRTPIDRWLRWIKLIALCAIIACSCDLLFLQLLPTLVDQIVVAACTALFVECASEGEKSPSQTLRAALAGENSAIVRGFRRILSIAKALLDALAACLRANEKYSLVRIAVAAVLGFLVMRGFLERGTTFIRPFLVEESASKEVRGEELAQAVAHRMRMLTNQLDAEYLRMSSPIDSHFGNDTPEVRTVPAQTGDGEMFATFEQDPLEFGSFRLPLRFVTDPLRWVFERMFKLRIVTGSVHKGRQDFILLASANDGNSWEATPHHVSLLHPHSEETAFDANLSTVLAKDLAFDIVSDDVRWWQAGMSPVREAFEEYEVGLKYLQDAERVPASAKGADDRQEAIAHLRASIASDPQFALAHYRIGLALQSDQEPAAAIAAFRAALNAKPNFEPAIVALAELLSSYEQYLPKYPSARALYATQDLSGSIQRRKRARLLEARNLWLATVRRHGSGHTWAARAKAYTGLCQTTLDTADETTPSDLSTYHEAYYYCLKAQRVYRSAALAMDLRDALAVIPSGVFRNTGAVLLAEGRARVALNNDRHSAENIGYLEGFAAVDSGGRRAGDHNSSSIATKWSCSIEDARIDPACDVSCAFGARCYEPSRCLKWEVQPGVRARQISDPFNDEPLIALGSATLSCDHARAGVQRHFVEPLDALQEDARAQLNLARELLKRAATTNTAQRTVWYRAAEDAFAAAVDIEPHNLVALNGFAYVFRVWTLAEGGSTGSYEAAAASDELLPYAVKAEAFARHAVDVAGAGEPRSKAIALSSLGEVLLSRGRPYEAAELLTQAMALHPDRFVQEETLWDLVEVARCHALRQGGTPRPLMSYYDDIDEERLIYEIIQLEHEREARPFMKVLSRAPTCLREQPTTRAQYAGRLEYSRSVSCIPRLRVDIQDGQCDETELIFHLSGSGLDERVSLGAATAEYALIPATIPASAHYTVQLIDGTSGQPLSNAVEVGPARDEQSCARYDYTVSFLRQHARLH